MPLMRPVLTALFLALAAPGLARADDKPVRIILPLSGDPDGAKDPQSYEREDPDTDTPRYGAAQICDLIAVSADEHELPRPFFARLIWKESRFDTQAVSPKGALGVAQFMPGTALRRGLRDPLDPEQAIPASAAYLAELRHRFGNLGLAAAAYNSGEDRVERWLADDGYLPAETEEYILDIFDRSAETFRDQAADDPQKPLDDSRSFEEACALLPVLRSRAATGLAAAERPQTPWGVRVAGHFDRAIALRQWGRVQAKHRKLIGDIEPVVYRQRTPIGRKSIYAVQIGVSTRSAAIDLCKALRGAGSPCLVVKNQ